MEIVYKLATRSAFSVVIVYPVISALTLGIFVKLITSLAGQSINKILGYTILIFVCVLFCVQIVYKNTFTTPFAFSIAFGEAGGVHALTEFADQTQMAIIKNAVWIMISLLPIVALIPLGRKFGLFKMAEKKENWILLITFLGVHIIGLISLLFSGDDGYTPKVLYYDHFVNEIGFDKLGVITSTKLDLKECILGVSDYLEKIEEEQRAREVFTLQFVEKSVEYQFLYEKDNIMKELVKMLLFDILVGNNDRHFYNWAVIRSITQSFKPRFSPIYDTARGLFWNNDDESLRRRLKNNPEAYIKKYCKGSRPKIGWDGENDINHFKLLSKIYENEFYQSKNEIKALFLQCDTAKMFRTIDSEFSKMLCPERIQMIKMCLEHRYNEIMRILE